MAAAAFTSALGCQCRTRGQGLTGLSPFCKKIVSTYNEYFYFYFIPT